MSDVGRILRYARGGMLKVLRAVAYYFGLWESSSNSAEG